MQVIHGIWAHGSCCLWAEDSALLEHAPSPRRAASDEAPAHPFACDDATLRAALAAAAGEPAAAGLEAGGAQPGELTLWLPTAQHRPLASPELVRPAGPPEPERPSSRSGLAAWQVPVLVLRPAPDLAGPGAPEIIAALAGGSSPQFAALGTGAEGIRAEIADVSGGGAAGSGAGGDGSGIGGSGADGEIVPGGSLRYLAAVAAMAADLAGRCRVLPALVPGPGTWAARWRPVLAGADAQRARELAAAMPPVFRAVTEHGGDPAALLSEALDVLTDAMVRGRLSPDRAGDGVSAGVPDTNAGVGALDAGVPRDTSPRQRGAVTAPYSLLPPRRGRRPDRVPVAERWAGALTGDPDVTVATPEDEQEASELARALEEWRSAAQAPAGPVRTCFRLVEPGAESIDSISDPGAGEAGAGEAGAGERLDGEPSDAWTVEFTLQSTDDPSLVLSAADVWAGAMADGAATTIVTGIKHPEEELLAGLGRAARLFPELDAELHTAEPQQVGLDSGGAYRFVKETAPLLSAAGFGVLLPAWARKARLGLKLTTRSRSASNQAVTVGRFGLRDLVDFRYDLAVGDQALDPGELEELASLKVPLVRLRGQWVELDNRQLQAALRFMQRARTTGTMDGAGALLTGLRGPEGTGDEEDGELPVTAVDADGWLGDLLSGQTDRRLEPIPAPAGFRGELRPYQERGLSWLSFLGDLGLGGVLADSMGLGKTVQVLGLLEHEKERAATSAPACAAGGTGREASGTHAGAPARPGGPDDATADATADAPLPGGVNGDGGAGRAVMKNPTLLVCPMSLVGNWQREAERFTPHLSVYVHHGSGRLGGDELAGVLGGADGADLVITTYGVAARDRGALSRIRWRRVVCDEAQNIKNSGTRQARAVRGIPAQARLALTGTPVENSLAELWSIMEFSNPGLLGPAERFRERYAVPVERYGDEEAAAAVRRHTGPFILRRLKTDKSIISDLPDKLEMKVWCNLTSEQASLYQATVQDMMARIESAGEGIERRGLVLATMAKLKQVCNHPAHLLGDGSRLPGRSGKLERLEEICAEITAAGDKALCFTQYAEFGAMLQPYLAARLGCEVPFLHGGVPKKQRDALVAAFQESAEPAVFLLSLKAGGTGLNLTAANHVIHVDRWWNPAVEDQATDRAFRIGQRSDVQVRKFVCVGTLEERIDAMLEEKKALAERIVGSGEGWLTELSTADLRNVVALSPEAVSE
jgi:SNF2 family DNA or RNA helicase